MSLLVSVDNLPSFKIKKNTSVHDILIEANEGRIDDSILGVFVNNQLQDLWFKINQDTTIRSVRIDSIEGLRIYQRTATFILLKALHDLHPTSKATVLHPLSDGLFLELTGEFQLTKEFIHLLEAQMLKLVKMDLPLIRHEYSKKTAIHLLSELKQDTQARLVRNADSSTVSLHELNGFHSFFLGNLAPRTSYIHSFKLTLHESGLVLHLPTMSNQKVNAQEPKITNLMDVLNETLKWRKILDLEDVGMLNSLIEQGKHQDFILLAEVLHEKRIAQIADTISKNRNIKVVLLAGPSASGKTTFTKRLSLQLRVNGLRPILISMDDYFLDREHTPRTSTGDFDFETPRALNIEMFSNNLQDLIDGKTIILPRFDFKSGKSTLSNRIVKPVEKNIFLIEGIHALNPLFSESLNPNKIFKIYVSPLSELPLDSHNWIPNADTRLLRRIIRDHQFRNYSAIETITRWPSVRSGESLHILPFQEEASVYFNTALLYEFSVIRSQIEPLLNCIGEDHSTFSEAIRLKKFLSFFAPIPKSLIPSHSILREFIGGSSFVE